MNIEKDFEEFFTKRHGELPVDTTSKKYAEMSYLKHEMKKSWDMATQKLEGCVVVPEAEFALLPKTITPEIEEILGMPCFKFIKAAQIYRQLGFEIPPKAEKEQSFFMFKFLHLALIHGSKCFDVFESETKAMVEAARGGNENT